MLNRIKKYIFNKFNIIKCEKCKFRGMKYGYYIRGWDEKNSAVCGDYGFWCKSCGHYKFKTPINNYIKSMQRYPNLNH